MLIQTIMMCETTVIMMGATSATAKITAIYKMNSKMHLTLADPAPPTDTTCSVALPGQKLPPPVPPNV